MKIFTIVGARPQFIKAAPVSRALREIGITESIVHTGQHFDAGMSDIFFEELAIPKPTHHLGISGGGHGAMTGAMLQSLEQLLETERPDWVLVYGDTNSTLAGTLAATKLQIPVAHVEAGLRSFDQSMPEEQNRIVADHLATLLFTPTPAATANLQREGISVEKIAQVGDVMFDATLYYTERARNRSDILYSNQLQSKDYFLATIHRAGNTDNLQRLQSILSGLNTVSRDIKRVVMPLHPRTRSAIAQNHLTADSIHVIEPVGYLDMLALEHNAALIATDSGGVQKEAYFQGVPCLTLRDETEWVELIDLGWNQLVPAVSSQIVKAVSEALGSQGLNGQPYGNGDAATKIAEKLHSL